MAIDKAAEKAICRILVNSKYAEHVYVDILQIDTNSGLLHNSWPFLSGLTASENILRSVKIQKTFLETVFLLIQDCLDLRETQLLTGLNIWFSQSEVLLLSNASKYRKIY